MMEVRAELRQLPPAEARRRLIALAREQGSAALEVLRAALQDPALAEAALEALGEVPVQEAWDLLDQFTQAGPAGRRKAARRSQHRLRSRGFRPAPPTTTRQEAAPAVEQARATPFDFVGNQFLRLIRPAALGMVRYADFIVGPEGLIECNHILGNRVDLENVLAQQDMEIGEALVEVGLGYVARRARAAAAHNRAAGKALPRDWPEAARLLDDAPEDPLPAELAAGASPEAAVTLREASRLFAHPSMARWLLEPARLMPYAEEWLHLLEYQPVRTEEGLPNLGALHAQGQIVARIVADLCDAVTIRRLAGQLVEQARLFHILGDRERAGLAMRCSAELAEGAGSTGAFFRILVEQSMRHAIRVIQEEAREQEQGPWVQAGGAAGPLWLPRPAAPEEDQEEPPRLWLPGQP